MKCLRLAALLAALLAAVPLVRAHDPGLSSVELELAGRGLRATLTFARADAALLAASGESGGTRDVRPAPPPAALEVLAGMLLEVEIDGARAAGAARASADAGNVQVTLDYPGPVSARLSVRSRVFALLPRGHRQYLSLRDGSGRVVADRLLEAGAERFEIPVDAAWKPRPAPVGRFLTLGIEHILTGWDHLVFLAGILLAGASGRTALRIITSFTVAHSITLGLGALGVVTPPSRLVEPAIALSIVYVGLENVFSHNLERRWLLTFAFGLTHGFGFASALRELRFDAQPGGVLVPLVSFNFGVELGQLAVAMLLLPVVWRLRERPGFATRWVPAASVLIALAGLYWFFERVAS
jgi:hydrogenase/urease accessory protein HupE